MNIKYLYGSIAVLFVAIVFLVPLGSNDSKSSKVVKEVVNTTKSIVNKEENIVLTDKEKYSDENIKRHNTIVIEDVKPNTLKKTQLSNNKEELDKQIDEKLAKLDAILKEKGIKLKKIEPSQEEIKLAQNRIEKIKKEFEELKANR